MTYFETELVFTPDKPAAKTATRSLDPASPGAGQAELLGITLRLGNRPLIYNLKDLYSQGDKPLLPSEQDRYLVVHAISALRTHGNARVDELQYYAAAIEPDSLQTVDLMPKTRFNEILKADLSLNAGLDLFGEMSTDAVSGLVDKLLDKFINLGPGTQLQLSASARFIGKFIFALQIPVLQSAGIGSSSCSWILKPDENKTPLLGDQLLIQSIAVPKGTSSISYTISGLVKADRGIFWKQKEQRTPDYRIDLDLKQLQP